MTRSRILVVDDKENMRKLFIRILAETYDVTTAIDGTSAIAHLRAERFDVVLTDIRMPGADGFEVLRCARAQSPETEVVMLTAYGSVEKAVEAIREGAYDYLTKPFDPDQVALVLARAVEKRRAWVDPRFGAREGEIESSRRPASGRRAPPESAGDTDRKRVRQVGASPPEPLAQMSYRQVLEHARDRVSREYLVALMEEFGGNVTHAAQHAGMERESLHRLLRRYLVRSEDFKNGP